MGGGGANTEAQQRELRAEEAKSRAEADKLALKNQQTADARNRAMLGRRSLIGTSELGVTDQLG